MNGEEMRAYEAEGQYQRAMEGAWAAMQPTFDKMDYPVNLSNGVSVDAFRSQDNNEEVALFIGFTPEHVTETGAVYTLLSKTDVQTLIERMVSALCQF